MIKQESSPWRGEREEEGEAAPLRHASPPLFQFPLFSLFEEDGTDKNEEAEDIEALGALAGCWEENFFIADWAAASKSMRGSWVVFPDLNEKDLRIQTHQRKRTRDLRETEWSPLDGLKKGFNARAFHSDCVHSACLFFSSSSYSLSSRRLLPPRAPHKISRSSSSQTSLRRKAERKG